MNPFETHGLNHLSASQINLFIAEPALWVAQYLYGVKGSFGFAAKRGISVERGIEHGLFNPDAPIQDCVDIAVNDFTFKNAFLKDPKKDKELDGIPGMVQIALEELRKYGTPEEAEGHQHKIVVDLDGIEVPILGYLDFYFPNHGIIVDLKTTLRLMPGIRAAHARQGAIYSRAYGDNVDMRFAYVTPKKQGVYSMDTDAVRTSWNEVQNVAVRIRNFLSVSKNKDDLASIVVPNYDSFYWNDPAVRQAGRDIFGF